MADNTDNILVEFDYDNITLIDPNRTIDPDGTVKERLVKQEDLVYYANLECNVLPRTKLAVGNALNDSQRTISVGKINFLNPGNKKFMDTAWSDEITGKGTLQGEGVNQVKLIAPEVQNPSRSSDYYITQNLLSNGKPGATDTGLLGMKDITVNIDSSFLPVIDITLEDVKGRALFEGGNNSPYAAFFQLPYPQFTLTLKGYYGKAIKLPIMLQSFTSSFDPGSHNFVIKLKFYGYKYTLLSYVNFGMLMAVPYMFENTITRPATTQTTQSTQTETAQKETKVYRGYEKMREIYSDYKSKGLIDDDFPEITLNQLRYRLDTFIKDILEKFRKENLGVITEISNYLNTLNSYRLDVYTSSGSWFNQYMDRKAPFVTTDGLVYYTFKKEYDPTQKLDGKSKLETGIIQKYNKILDSNSVLGKNGSYTVGGKQFESPITFNITIQTVNPPNLNPATEFDLIKTYKERFPNVQRVDITGDTNYISFKAEFEKSLTDNKDLFFIFENPGGFIPITDGMSKDTNTFKKTIEQQITDNLAEQFTSNSTGLGFVPSIRNILAVFYCQGEAFLRLLDEVHKKSWDQRNNKYRRAAIFGNQSTAPSVDIKTSTQNDEPIYPWPQVLKETTTDNNKEKFELVYPGDLSVASTYNAFNPEVWPEVEFVEEFITGYVKRQSDESKADPIQVNLLGKPKRISLNSIDFPVSDQVFQNKEQAKYFYEIYERVILNSYYSKLGRQTGYPLSIYNVEAENEAINILESLGTDNPYLSKILKEYLIDQNNFIPFLRHISNQGQGESWQRYIRGEFTTPYIRGEVNNPNKLFNIDILSQGKSQPDVTVKNESNVRNISTYVGDSTSSNLFDFTDIYPITNLGWDQTNLADGQSLQSPQEAYDTKDVLRYNTTQKTITNFSSEIFNNNDAVRPFTNFNFSDLNITPNNTDLRLFYVTRKIEDQFITEGNINYSEYSGNVLPNQTTSILNSPYFMNAIIDGVKTFRYNQSETSPYKAAAYLFLNSLPLSTLREKYRTKNEAEDLDYLISTFKKFGAIHRLPYAWVLKYGSIWNRYKTWLDTGNDMLDSSWTNFNYLQNYDPVNSASTKTFNLTINNTPETIVLNQNTGIGPYTNINVGFYPQLMEDFNVFLQGRGLYTGQTQVTGNGQIVEVTGNCSPSFTVTGLCSVNGGSVAIIYSTNTGVTVNGTRIEIPSLGVAGNIISQTAPNVYQVSNIPPGTIGTFLNCSFGNFTTVSDVNYPYLYNGVDIKDTGLITTPITLGNQISGTTGGNGLYQISTGTTSGSSFSTGGQYMVVSNVDSNVLVNGSQISGTLMTGVTINSQLSGTTAGPGVYKVSPSQSPTTSSFTVAGSFITGVGSGTIQNLIDTKKLIVFKTNGSKIDLTPGFDPTNPTRTLKLATWSVLSRTNDLASYYVLPSFGSNINQTKSECVVGPLMTTNFINNPAMYNGSVRLYWNAPNYGWFDNSEVVKNSPDTYLKTIFNNKKTQQNFSINGNTNDYTDISEIFTTFDKGALDLFEKEFLNFSKAVYDFEDTLPSLYTTPTSTDTSPTELVYKNFQGLMRDLLKVSDPVGNSGEEILNDVIAKQNLRFQSVLNGFINYNCVFKYGNPSFFNRKIFNSYSFQFIEDRYVANPYVQGTLPTNGGSITLSQSKSTNPDAWKALETYVGFSTIPELAYSDSGSYITDFFPTMNIAFEENDIFNLAPLIKIFATQKLNNPNITRADFFNSNDAYLESCLTYANNVISVLMPSVRAELPTVFIDQENKTVRSPLESQFTEQTRVELWETFKALNDAWIAGFDLSNKTLFEDVMLVDRASRDVGDKICVDIFKIKDLIESYSYKNSLLDTIETIVKTNNFQSFMLPSYVNFYNVQDAEKNPVPKPDGSLEFANSLFGTFLNVDYRNSSPKYLCMYVAKPSEHLDMSDNVDYRFRDDAFDLRRSSDNPLIESQQGKTDWARSNKVVGFNVDITQQNQQIFKQLDLNQDPGKPTSESLEALNQMANQGRNRGTTTQNVSLYNLYKNRSYECSIDMMGNALMQPTMYFNLRNIPMFSGPYLVTKVSHRINEDGFETTITGTRQSFSSLPKVDGFIQSLNINIVNTIQQKVIERETSLRADSKNVIAQKTQIIQNVTGTDSLANGQTCQAFIDPRYRNYTPIETPERTTQTLKALYTTLKEKYVAKGYTGGTSPDLLYYTLIAYTFIYVDSVNNTGGISAYQHNYSTFDLKEYYNQEFVLRTDRNFVCINRGDNETNIPIASFPSFNDFIEFVISVIPPIKSQFVTDVTQNPDALISLAKNYVLKYPIQRESNIWTDMDNSQRAILVDKFKKASDSFFQQSDIVTNSNLEY
jgi:hypothetical protein